MSKTPIAVNSRTRELPTPDPKNPLSAFPEVLGRIEARREKYRAMSRGRGGPHEAKLVSLRYKENLEEGKELIAHILDNIRVPGSLTGNAHTLAPEDSLEIAKERYSRFFDLLSKGSPLESAIMISGVPRRRFRAWMRQGGDKDHNGGKDLTDQAREPYRSFALSVRAVQAYYNQTLVEIIRTAGDTDWKAAAWILERRDPANYGKQVTDVKVGIQTDGQSQVLIYVPSNGREADLTDEDSDTELSPFIGNDTSDLDDPDLGDLGAIEAEFSVPREGTERE